MGTLKKRVLIADCDEQILIDLERWLEDDGFETTTAWSTRDTVDLLTRESFDLLLVADHPPELNCEQILRPENNSGTRVPVIVLETRPRHPFAEPYLRQLGACNVVQKWRQHDVIDAVEAVLGHRLLASKSAVAGTSNLG
jgi:DNA-binding response OmpR family regulator